MLVQAMPDGEDQDNGYQSDLVALDSPLCVHATLYHFPDEFGSVILAGSRGRDIARLGDDAIQDHDKALTGRTRMILRLIRRLCMHRKDTRSQASRKHQHHGDSWAHGQAVACPEVGRQDEVVVTLSDRAGSDKNLHLSQVYIRAHIYAYCTFSATHVISVSARAESPRL